MLQLHPTSSILLVFPPLTTVPTSFPLQVLHDYQTSKSRLPSRSSREGLPAQLLRHIGGFTGAAAGSDCHLRKTRPGGHEELAGSEQRCHEEGAPRHRRYHSGHVVKLLGEHCRLSALDKGLA